MTELVAGQRVLGKAFPKNCARASRPAFPSPQPNGRGAKLGRRWLFEEAEIMALIRNKAEGKIA